LNELFLNNGGDAAKIEIALHTKAKELLKEHRIQEAWLTLLSFNH
jgi:hypothetical protein